MPADPQFVARIQLLTDITEREQAPLAHRQVATMLESTSEGVMFTDREGRILRVNPAFTRITGYSAPEAIGKTPKLLQSGRHDADFYRSMWETLERRGAWQGEIWNRRKSGQIYPQWLSISAVRDEHGAVINYVAVFADISSIKESQKRLDFLAHYDPLTELPNRLLLSARLQHALQAAPRHGRQVAVLLLDLDRFNDANDSLGHAAGDAVLVQTASRLREIVRQEDTVARLHGDQFAVVVEEISDERDVARVVRRLLHAIAHPLHVDDHELVVTASVGISLYPEDGAEPETLLKNAETAMYQAMRSGGNTYAYYTAELTRSAKERFSLETSLRRALERSEFELHFQPQVDLSSGRATGVEALVRWRHPQQGLISPARFIPLAEETGLIVPLGEWVLREACAAARRLQPQVQRPLQMAVNLSGRQLADPGLEDTLRCVLSGCGLEPELIELEITESTVTPQAHDLLCAFRDQGVRIAIDDFGTGYSSLARLKQLPIDRLKIDRAFVRDIPENGDDASIAKAIITMAHSLGLEVVAEGVETEAQLAFLQEHGCDEVQGFHFSRPLPEEELVAWLKGR